MSKKNTRRALLSSALALLLCVSMLIGSTFAWFTDEVVSSNNIIKSGTLDITMEWADGTKEVPGETGWTDASKGAIFNYDLWEPGYTEVRHVKIANVGTLALKYVLNIVPTGEVSDLAKVIDVYYADPAVQVADRTALKDENKIGTLSEVLAGMASTAVGELKAGESVTVTLALKMQEEAGNEYQNKSIGSNFSVQLMATQLTAESDSFGPDYDAGAYLPVVYTAEELKSALANGDSVKLGADITVDESLTVAEGSSVTLDLNGKTLSNPVGYVFENKGNLTIDGNGTVTGLGIIRSTAGKVTVESGNFYASSRWQDSTYQHTLKAENTVVVINGGNFDATVNGQTNAVLNADAGSTITINGGSFKNVSGDLGQFDPYLFTYEKDGKVIINDGSFYGGWRFNGETATTDIYGGTFTVGFDGQSFNASSTHVVTVYGGTFANQTYAKLTAKLSDIVAEGYKAVESNGKYVVVPKSVDAVVSTPEELTSALATAAAAGAGDSTIVLNGDIDLSNTSWTPVNVDGYNGAGVVTVEGSGATITGLSAPLFAGGFAGKSGIVIKNLTIADSKIASTSGLGGGAFVDSADSMQVITLENCHLVNSTVSGERAGGLIGWCTGYAKLDDGPVKAYVTITKCSVVDSTVIGAGSAGGIAGHPGASDYTYTTIEDCAVKNVNVISNDDGSWRTGAVVGTANNGHIVINKVAVEKVTLTQNGVTATETVLYGRFVPAGTGTLEIDGVAVNA